MAIGPRFRGGCSAARYLSVVLSVMALLTMGRPVQAQVASFGQQVGGVFIGPDGVLRNREVDETNQVRAVWAEGMAEVPGELKQLALRKISLRRLQAAIAECRTAGIPPTDEMRFLAGIQRIQYVFVYPQEQDIVLAGPGEGWRLNEQSEVVGITTGRPVMWLDDLVVALRTAQNAQTTGISCSIDPSNAGILGLQKLAPQLAQTTWNDRSEVDQATAAIEQTLGMQKISVTGIPGDSHFARVIVAADYKMKRLAMNFDPAPIKGLPSFLAMMKGGGSGMQNMLPRWWLEPNYESLLVSPDGLAWEFRGASVKAMTEEDFITQSGARKPSGKANPAAKKWADNMTAHYSELSAKEPVFGQLRNCIDLAVVGALIIKDHLSETADCKLSGLLEDPNLPALPFEVPKHVPSLTSVLKKGSSWVISASGGVQVLSWQVASKTEQSATVAPNREKATPAGQNWWWN